MNMGSISNPWKRVSILVALFCTTSYICAGTHRDDAVGYSLTVPDDWRAIARSDMDQALRMLRSGGQHIEYVGGFEPQSHIQPFTYPYVLVQRLSHDGNRSVKSVADRD